MLSLKYKDIKKRFLFCKRELDKHAFKAFFINAAHNKSLSVSERKKLNLFYSINLSHKHSKTKIQRRCLLTNRGRVSNSKFGISRIKLRELLKFNIIPGNKTAI